MKTKRILKHLGLSSLDFDEIKASVKAAEKNTSGEISIAVIGESSDYSFFELTFAVFIGVLSFAIMLPFYKNISTFFDKIFWEPHDWYVTAFYGVVSFLSIAIVFFIANFPVVDRLIVPSHYRSTKVKNRAIRHFVQSGIYATKDRSGILIFVSLLEREVIILSDTGIAKKIPQSQWDKIADDIAFGFRSGLGAASLNSAVERCGKILEKHFPSTTRNINELSDDVVILEENL